MATIHLRNLSSKDQVRFCCAMVPTTALQALQLGQCGITKPEGWLWQRGGEVGDQTRLWIRANLVGNEARSIDLFGFRVIDDVAWMAPPVRFDWLFDKPEDAVLKIAINGAENAMVFDRLIETGPMVSIFRFKLSGMGFHAVAYATVAVGQDVFDLQGFVVWNDRKTQAVTLGGVRLELRHGEQHAPMLAASLGQLSTSVDPWRTPHVIVDGSPDNWLFDAAAYPFYGTLIAEPDVPAKDADTVDLLRLHNAEAAHGGPILALADAETWRNRIGPHHASSTSIAFSAQTSGFIDRPRSPWASRPWANPSQSGQTGDQGVFGRIKALHIFRDGDPRELMALRYASTDYFLRSHHFLDEHSQPLLYDQSDPRTTYGTAPFWRGAGTLWGKNDGNHDPVQWGWDHGERAYLDPQHRANLYLPISLMLLGDPILQDELDYLLACDSRDTRMRDQSLEAVRAAGRLLQEWAWWWCVANQQQRQHLQDLAQRMFAICQRQTEGMSVTGPVRSLKVWSRLDSKNPLRDNTTPTNGREMWVPWEHSFVCDGLTAWAAIWQRIGDAARMTAFLSMAVTLANVVVDWGLIEHSSGAVIVCTYVQWNPDGAPNPPEYYTLPRPYPTPRATSDLNGDADLIYGGIGLAWYSGAILTASKAGNPKAQRIRQVLYSQSVNQRDVEWLVGD